MRWSCGRVLLGAFAEVLVINELIVKLTCAQPPHGVMQVNVDGLTGEQPRVQLALHLLRKCRPVSTDDLHADEFRLWLSQGQACVTLARAARAVAGMGKKKLHVQLFELEFELAGNTPPRGNVGCNVGTQLLRQCSSLLA